MQGHVYKKWEQSVCTEVLVFSLGHVKRAATQLKTRAGSIAPPVQLLFTSLTRTGTQGGVRFLHLYNVHH